MMMRSWNSVWVTLATALAPAGLLPAAPAVDFSRDIQPIFAEHCAECHGGVKRKGGLNLTNRTDAFSELDSGRHALVPGDLENSELIARVTAEDEDQRMPPEHPLPDSAIAKLETWVKQGANWPVHWSLEPLQRPEVPPVPQGAGGWTEHEIDRFVMDELRKEGVEPSPEADPATLVRRLSLDLLGLLPDPTRSDRFARRYRAADETGKERIYEELVDEFLTSPHFGERWGRHWLDEARYADSAGYEKDSPREDAFRFRDWVIDAVNADMPFDEFTTRQIAGDLLPGATEDDQVATMFHLMTQFNLEGGVDAEEDRTKRVIDRVSTVGTVWLAASVECMQCHDHPYDPMTQREFYQLYAFFNNADFGAIFAGEDPPDAEKKRAQRREKWEPVAQLLEDQVTEKSLATKLQRSLTQMRRFDNANGFTRVLRERTEDRRTTYVFHRGNFQQPETEAGPVKPGTPGVLPPLRSPGERADRLDLARWLTRPDHPLTSRVTVNKIWMHLFGAPLAGSPRDFGMTGQAPRYPDLLDWLAVYFARDAAWSRKELIRKIVTSSTYRQSSAIRPGLSRVDPRNELLARQNRFRVEGEVVRDISLQAAGLLSREIGGPSVFPPIPDDVAALSYANNFRWKTSPGADRYRRGLYTFLKRTAPDPNLTTFDCPEAAVTTQRRGRSNTPLQALTTLQNEVFHEAAQAFAERVLELDASREAERLETAFRIALSRSPREGEREALAELLADARRYYQEATSEAAELVGSHRAESVGLPESAAWVATVRVLLNLDEFLTRT